MGELTGRKVLLITLAAFGTIIGVNLTLAFNAVRTFPGLEVASSYVASQRFDRERAAQDALGWRASASHERGVLTLAIRDASGAPARLRHLAVTVGRPTHVREDQSLPMQYHGGLWTAHAELGPGLWNVHVTAEATDGTAFRQRLDHLRVRDRG
ncbi:nitrogen fixation protein FixH [Paracoccus sp. S-4012]|uniref:FixH family protein n=1 Tax=Paracoccus sp. S-4012 TaxID=2665648 RepID=UPI0012AFF4E2|nr:FixH family protein [Paracoccus sp. S-4012]MRX50875.1 nitrogen fixation protein FixH [Paracoccus sp. S-4012]